jgi:hypothetical protein
MNQYKVELKPAFFYTIFLGIVISLFLQVLLHLFGEWEYYYHGCMLYCHSSSHFISFDDYEASPNEISELINFFKLKMSIKYSLDSHFKSFGVTAIISIVLLNILKLIDFKIVNKDGGKIILTNDDLKIYLSIFLILLLIGIFLYNIFHFKN